MKQICKNPLTRQFQLEYAFYVMLSSWFASAVCSSKRIEKRLHLYYQELPFQKQYRMEKEMLDMIRQQLLPSFPVRGLAELHADFSFVPRESGKHYIKMDLGYTAFYFDVEGNGGKLRIRYVEEMQEEQEQGAA